MKNPTRFDLAVADQVNALAPETFPLVEGPLTPEQRREYARHAAQRQRLAYDQARQVLEAVRPAVRETIVYHDGQERAAAQQPRWFQPFSGAVIVDATNGEPYWGGPFVEGIYYGAIGAAERARRNAIERAHRAALRDDEDPARRIR